MTKPNEITNFEIAQFRPLADDFFPFVSTPDFSQINAQFVAHGIERLVDPLVPMYLAFPEEGVVRAYFFPLHLHPPVDIVPQF